MKRERHTPGPIINRLREAEVALAQGSTVAEASRQIEVTEQRRDHLPVMSKEPGLPDSPRRPLTWARLW